MNYQEFIDHIYVRHASNVKLGLDRMFAILKKMGNPEKKMKGFHVAGTNGKGSTSAILESLSNSYGLSTGMNTSPHLVDYKERFRISGKKIKFEDILRIYRKFEKSFDEYEASFFEITTAIAFYYFYEQNLDLAIMEVGLGGRLDGTKPFIPTVSLITSIGIDHAQSLGGTIAKIAWEKAGIFKEKIPAVIGKVDKEALDVIKEEAAKLSVPLSVYNEDFTAENIRLNEKGTIFNYVNNKKNFRLNNLKLNLLGRHQAYNASCAITAFLTYLEKNNIEFSEEKLRKGLQNVFWPGRMQILAEKPTVIIDGAHNEHAIRILSKNIQQIFPEKTLRIVVSILRDKNIDYMISELGKISHKLYISKNLQDRAADIQTQIDIAEKNNFNYVMAETVPQALKKALKESGEDEIIFVTGSLYTISEILSEDNSLKL